MRLNIQDLAKKNEKTHLKLNIHERLPPHISGPCTISADFAVQKQDDYFLLKVQTEAELNIICQRCAQIFQTPYENETELAICNTDERAESLLAYYDCMVPDKEGVDLQNIITDELHLYSPQFHPKIQDCDKMIHQFISDFNTN